MTESFAGGATRLTTRTYDGFDPLFSETAPGGMLGWRYDLVGNRTRQIDSSGAAAVYTRRARRIHPRHGRQPHGRTHRQPRIQGSEGDRFNSL